MPRPDAALLSGSAAPDSQVCEKPCKKRQRIIANADEHFDPKTLPQTLWTRLGVNIASLPDYLRPGERAR